MVKETEIKKLWFISLYASGFNRQYYFNSNSDRDYIYDLIKDKVLKKQFISIKDSVRKEEIVLGTALNISKGELDNIDLEYFDKYKKDDLIISFIQIRI